mgnify:CR=1 FL=1
MPFCFSLTSFGAIARPFQVTAMIQVGKMFTEIKKKRIK